MKAVRLILVLLLAVTGLSQQPKQRPSVPVKARGVGVVPGAIVCPDHQTVSFMFRWYGRYWEDAQQDALTHGQSRLLREPTAKPDFERYKCALIAPDTPMMLEVGNVVPVVTAKLPEGRSIRGVTLTGMFKRVDPQVTPPTPQSRHGSQKAPQQPPHHSAAPEPWRDRPGGCNRFWGEVPGRSDGYFFRFYPRILSCYAALGSLRWESGHQPRSPGVYTIVSLTTKILLLAAMFVPHVSTAYPWVYPGDFRERLRMSDLVVSGTVMDTSRAGTRVVDGTEVTANVAHLRIDRVFQGEAPGEDVQFIWLSMYIATGRGFVYSGPPLASFRPAKRYLIFLKRTGSQWEVAMPVYALEVELTTEPLRDASRDVSRAPLQQRYQALAEELETVALAQPVPPRGVTGIAATNFPAVFDLLAGCAEPFYRHFLGSPSPELRKAALDWLELIRSRQLRCQQSFTVQ